MVGFFRYLVTILLWGQGQGIAETVPKCSSNSDPSDLVSYHNAGAIARTVSNVPRSLESVATRYLKEPFATLFFLINQVFIFLSRVPASFLLILS